MWSLIQCCVCRYSFACVGINLTHMSYRMWNDGTAKTHVYNACHQTHAELPDISHFHRFYCYLYFEFDKLWLSEKPTNIMDFSRIRDMFEERVRLLLADRSALLKLNFSIDQIWKQRHSQSPFLAFIQFLTGRFPQIYAYRLFIDLINICWENVVYCLDYLLSGSRNWNFTDLINWWIKFWLTGRYNPTLFFRWNFHLWKHDQTDQAGCFYSSSLLQTH